MLSGRSWTSRFPAGRVVQYMLSPRAGVDLVMDAVGGQLAPVIRTLISPERSYLMYYAFRIAREGLDPAAVPALRGLEIDWVHRRKDGSVDGNASRGAAEQMVQGFGLARRPEPPGAGAPASTPESGGMSAGRRSGREWVSAFRDGGGLEQLTPPFRDNVKRFVSALRAARATVSIADAFRAPERAYLMHYAFRIAREALDPSSVPGMRGVDIEWVHTDAAGAPDLVASRSAAEQMVQGYHIVYRPALQSRHTQGLAVDMNITWQGDLTIPSGGGAPTRISTTPRDGGRNTDLHQVGASYGVIKLVRDPPHWSSDGR